MPIQIVLSATSCPREANHLFSYVQLELNEIQRWFSIFSSDSNFTDALESITATNLYYCSNITQKVGDLNKIDY